MLIRMPSHCLLFRWALRPHFDSQALDNLACKRRVLLSGKCGAVWGGREGGRRPPRGWRNRRLPPLHRHTHAHTTHKATEGERAQTNFSRGQVQGGEDEDKVRKDNGSSHFRKGVVEMEMGSIGASCVCVRLRRTFMMSLTHPIPHDTRCNPAVSP